MSEQPVPAAEPRRILALAREDRNAARRELARMPIADQVALVCESSLAARREILDLLPAPELVVPELPEADLCFTAKAIGLADAGWLLAHATPEQIVACVDLDVWSQSELVPDRAQLGAWLATLADAGETALLASARSLDPELLVLWLRDRLEVWLKPNEQDWLPPDGAQTLEGQFFFRARRDGDDLSEVRPFLDVLFREDYWTYFRLLQGVTWELEADTEEWALRWRTGRLEDLGFPRPDEALAIYSIVPARSLDDLADAPTVPDDAEWRMPVWIPRLPVSSTAAQSLFRTLAALGADERKAYLYAFLTLANRVAVADKLPLGDADSIPKAVDKAASLTSRGIDHLVAARGVSPTDALRRSTLERLFRIGFTLAQRESVRPEEARARAARTARAPSTTETDDL
jgi:hypothetical protein